MSLPVMKARLYPRAEKAVRGGHPWVFAESIQEVNREGEAGEAVAVYDRSDRLLAVGLYDPDSPIRLRVVHVGSPARLDRSWWWRAAEQARDARSGVFSEKTNGARCIHGENDGFPGLVADCYADTMVVKLYSAIWLPRWQEVQSVLREVFQPRHLVLRLSRNLVGRASAHSIREGFVGGVGEAVVVFQENGIRWEADVLRGQKTGFFLDQRENRERVEQMAEGRDVLNLFSFSGGFSLYAARGGASQVTDVDISAHALESARRNYALNADFNQTPHVTIQADVFEWLRTPGGGYDLVITDPPSLAKRERERAGALVAYRKLNEAALRRVRPGGILLAASCSAHVRDDEFCAVIRDVARASGRNFGERWVSGHAADHPARFPEAKYLKALCLEFA
jgi:23S rRNA (cytosine1962-C5)-methyltransferase